MIAQAQSVLDKILSLRLQDVALEKALEHIQLETGVYFAYSPEILPSAPVSVDEENVTLHEALNRLFQDTGIKFMVYAGQIVLQKAPPKPKNLTLNGLIVDSETHEPVPYATVQILPLNEGAVADGQGRFVIEIRRGQANDTLVFSSMGYERSMMAAGALSSTGFHKIYLDKKTIELNPVEVNANDFKTRKLGNGGIATGSMYIDTHGQQTALFIDNEKAFEGKITEVRYYLSRKGNTETPFRIRIYQKDTLHGKPGKDLLGQMVVLKPEKKSGWVAVDISEYNISIPVEGFFVAIEGVFPNEYERYIQNTGFFELSEQEFEIPVDEEDFITESISYGQRLGYCRKKPSQTWHYSLSGTWFQVEKRSYSAMIGATIEYKKDKKKKNE